MSSPDVAPDKRCVLCGQDCTNRPRNKDNRGRYYCRECYEKVERKRTAVAPAASPRPAAASGAPRPAPKPAARSSAAGGSDLVGDLAALASAAPAADVARICPSCSAPLAINAILCTGCGYNLQSGQRIRTQALAATKARRSSGPSLPKLSGVFASPAIVWGGVLLVFLILFAVGRTNDSVALLLGGVTSLFGLGVAICIVVHAFRTSIGAGLVCLFVGLLTCGLYWLYYVLAKTASTHLKVAYAVSVVGNVLTYFLRGHLGLVSS